LRAEGDRPALTVDRHRPGGAARTPDLGDEVTSTAVLDDVACPELFSCDDHVGTPFRVCSMYDGRSHSVHLVGLSSSCAAVVGIRMETA